MLARLKLFTILDAFSYNGVFPRGMTLKHRQRSQLTHCVDFSSLAYRDRITFRRCFIMCVNRTYEPRAPVSFKAHTFIAPFAKRRKRHTRHVDGQDGVQRQGLGGTPRLGGNGRPKDEHALARDAQRVQDVEGAVADPGQERGQPAGEGQGKVVVADDLGDGPGDEHGCVEGRQGEEGPGVDNGPHEEEAGRDLHGGRGEGGADDAFGGLVMLFAFCFCFFCSNVSLPRRECRTSISAMVCVHFVHSPTPR